ncbi:hypothetical protein [Deinococcus pimensis]|uniref:hypothetical protein n=1 Tax=Deinococcus pimensis TaxID=309888 RepID=UPI00048119B5|nr:hypothetical protein [Deinococcus pimensis]
MKPSVLIISALVTFTSCGRTGVTSTAVTPLAAEQTSFPFSYEQSPDYIGNPCTGEQAVGTLTVSGVTTLVTDAQDGLHYQVDVSTSATYQGERGTTFTYVGAGHWHFNLPSSGAQNRVELVNGRVTASDGTQFLLKERFHVVIDANGVTRIEGNNDEKNALRCQGR